MDQDRVDRVENDGDDAAGDDASASNGLATVDLATGTTGASTAPAGGQPVKRGRGRPPGSGTARASTVKPAQTKTVQASVSGIEQLLFGLHQMASRVIGEEFELPHDECKQIAEPMSAVAALYPNSVISPKVLAWTALGGAIASIHGPRFAARMMRMKMEREEKLKERANMPRVGAFNMNRAPVQQNAPVSAPAPANIVSRNAEQPDFMTDPAFVSFTPERSDH